MKKKKLDPKKLAKQVVGGLVKLIGILVSLYMFVCSLTFLSTSFRILGGRNLSSLFSSSDVLSNPVVGVMIGILTTVLVQSSATSTSIIVSLVSAGVEVRHAVPMIFGSNVGTSVTNTIVSIAQAADRETFRRAFAAATVHDMFNWLSVAVLLVLEVSTGALERLSSRIVDAMPLGDGGSYAEAVASKGGPDLLKKLTKPLTDKVVRLDKKVLLGWSFRVPEYENVTSLLESDCGRAENEPCDFLLSVMGEHGWGVPDVWLGVFLLAFSLCLLCVCLVTLMKILNSMLGSRVADLIQKTVNADVPYVPWLTGYVGILIGAIVTILVRSSSVFTSTLTPLCGAGLVTLETVYPMTLGSNVGTTTTSILASFAAEGKYLKPSVQIAMVHLLFNVVGILIFYPVPMMRWPLPLARRLGDCTAEYRWFAALYLVLMFFLLPALVFVLSLAGPAAVYAFLGPVAALAVAVAVVTVVQKRRPEWLPAALKNWNFLPPWLRSLKPLDDLFGKIPCCRRCTNVQRPDVDLEEGIRGKLVSDAEPPTKSDFDATLTDEHNGHVLSVVCQGVGNWNGSGSGRCDGVQ